MNFFRNKISKISISTNILTKPQTNHLNETNFQVKLPSQLISLNSIAGKNLFKQSILDGRAEIFFQLSGNFSSQSEPAYCGLVSLSMVLNSLNVDPLKRWKGFLF